MTLFKRYLIDLRDFSYMAYARRYGRVSAKKWSGYRSLFIAMYSPYYLLLLMIMKRFIPKSFYTYAQANPPGLIEIILALVILLLPPILLINARLKKWEDQHPILFKAIKSQWRDKQILGISTFLGGWAAIFLYFKLTELFG